MPDVLLLSPRSHGAGSIGIAAEAKDGMDEKDLRLLRATPLFRTIPFQVVQRLIGNHLPRAYPRGTVLFQQDEPAAAFFIIFEGWVKLFRMTPDGEEAVIGVFHRGETFAEAAMFMGGRYPASAETVSPARLLKVDAEIMVRQIRETPELALSLLASASVHLKVLVEQIEQLKLLSTPQRLADFLIRLSLQPTGPSAIELPYEKSLIAKRLGMTPESFSRALARLRAFGVTVEQETVQVADMSALSAFVAGDDNEATQLAAKGGRQLQ